MMGFFRNKPEKPTASVIVLQNGPECKVALRRSSRAKRLSLRVGGTTAKVTLTIPSHVGLAEARAFAMEKEDWIRKHLDQASPEKRAEFGQSLPFKGASYPIVEANVKRVLLRGDTILAPAGAEMLGPRCQAWLKQEARHTLEKQCSRFAQELGLPYGRIALKDTSSRWGSCSSAGNLNFSWRIIMAPPDVLEYLAAHEVAHLAEMNHSPAFWATVRRLLPGYEVPKHWLKTHGTKLHRYSFD